MRQNLKVQLYDMFNPSKTTNMKRIVKYAGIVLTLSPTLLMLNESTYLWVNLIGAAYTIALCQFCRKTRMGKRIVADIEELLNGIGL